MFLAPGSLFLLVVRRRIPQGALLGRLYAPQLIKSDTVEECRTFHGFSIAHGQQPNIVIAIAFSIIGHARAFKVGDDRITISVDAVNFSGSERVASS